MTRAPGSEVIGLRAPWQKNQGSGPPPPLLGLMNLLQNKYYYIGGGGTSVEVWVREGVERAEADKTEPGRPKHFLASLYHPDPPPQQIGDSPRSPYHIKHLLVPEELQKDKLK